MFDINSLYTYQITLYPEDNHKWGKCEIEMSGLIIADGQRDALEKVYEHCGVKFGKTICHPNVRHFIREQLPYMGKGELTTGFSIINENKNDIIVINPKKPKRSGRDIVEIVKEKFDKLMTR